MYVVLYKIKMLFLGIFVLGLLVLESEGCQSRIGGTCVGGTAIAGDLRGVNRVETCADDPFTRDWCVVV